MSSYCKKISFYDFFDKHLCHYAWTYLVTLKFHSLNRHQWRILIPQCSFMAASL